MKDGWEIYRLGDVCQVVNGGTPKTGIGEYWDGPHAWMTPAEMGRLTALSVSSTERTLTDSGLTNSSAKLVPADSVILSTRAPIGHVAINGVPMAFNQGCRGLVPGPLILTKYLYYFLQHSKPLLEGLGTGATFKELSAGRLKEVQIPVPSRAEQEHVTRILDEALSALDEAQNALTAARDRGNDLARAQLDEAIESALAQWPIQPLGDVADFRNGVNYTRSSRGPERAIIGVKDFKDHFHAPPSGLSRVRLDTPPSPNDLVEVGDLLTVRSNGNPDLIGRCLLVSEIQQETVHSGFTIRIRLRTPKDLLPAWVAWVLRSPRTRRILVDHGTGTNIRSLNQGALAAIPVPVPPPREQERQAKALAQVRQMTSDLARSFDARCSAIEDLRSSLLERAFRGAL